MRRDNWNDAVCIVLISFASALPHATHLGFYSDDWGLFSDYQFHGFSGLFSNFPGRPVQALQSALLFSVFGWTPLGHHLTITALLALAGALLYWLLLRLGFGRAGSFSTAVLFLLLPQLSTVRVWVAAAQVPLSFVFAMLSLHAQLGFDRSGRPLAAVLALVAAIFSVGSYEIFAPLILSFALVLLWRQGRGRNAAASGALSVLLLAVLFYKIGTGRAGEVTDVQRYAAGAVRLVSPGYDWRIDSGLNIFAALQVHFWLTLEGWGKALLGLLSGGFSWSEVLASAAAGALTYWRLRTADVSSLPLRRLLLLGIAVFILGHATFLIVPSILFSPTGMGNRVLVAAAIGVAMIISSLVALAAIRMPRTFPSAMGVVVVFAALWIERIQSYWAEAPMIQRKVLAAARNDLSNLPPGSTVILDGVCPYHGPAVVFEAAWDVGGALSWALGREVSGDTVSPRMSLTRRGLLTSMYREPYFYPYGPGLYAYNPNLRLVAPLTSVTDARTYFQRSGRWPNSCPPGFVGHGVLI